MNSVDVADHMHQNYNFSHWLRNRKWWWALFMWGFGVMLVNSYQLYLTECLYIWCVPVKEIISQCKFRKQICLSWLKKHNYHAQSSPQSGLRCNESTISVPCLHNHKLNWRNKDENVQKAPMVSVTSIALWGELGIWLDKSVQNLPLSNVKDLRKCHLVCSVHR